ncbi:MAG: HDOD domain-containing protein [Gemmatimonadales bacterium]|nr:MAG: HDOD domain-containing protein [Gemmatimonadales bacterium]
MSCPLVSLSRPLSVPPPPPPSPGAPNLFLARQPILDAHGRLHGYELLFRSGPENAFGTCDPDAASHQTIGAGVMGFGLDSLVGESLAFINATRDVLVSGVVRSLPEERVVIEILETVPPDDEVVAACRDLWEDGYRFAMDDWEGPGDRDALLPFCHMVKLDVLDADSDRLVELAGWGLGSGMPFVAERVETRAMHREVTGLGFTFFQGYYFCEPEMVQGRQLEANQVSRLRLLQLMSDPDLDFDQVEDVIRQDVALPVTLLRYLNSAAFGWRHEVESIGHGLRIMGEVNLRRWALMATLMGLGEGHPAELINLSLMRAHFCEAIAVRAWAGARSLDAFLVGLLANLDALLGHSMEGISGSMSLPEDVASALLARTGPLSDLLAYARAFELGDWEAVSRLGSEMGVRGEEVPALYAEAAVRGRKILQSGS